MTGIPALTSLLVLRMNRQQDPQSVSAKDITAVPTQLSAAAAGSNGHRSQAAACNVEPGAVTILEFDDTGLIRRYRSYYDKLHVMEQIASGLPGVYGWFARALVGYLVAQGKKGLDTSSA